MKITAIPMIVRNIYSLLVAILLIIISSACFGQAVRVDIPLQTTGPQVPGGPPGPLPQALWLANAGVTLCSHPSATLAACQASPILTYTDSTEGTTCPAATPLVQLPGNTCTAFTGAAANIGFWYNGGTFDYWVTASYGSFGPFTVTAPNFCSPGGCTITGTVTIGTTLPTILAAGGGVNANAFPGATPGAKIDAACASFFGVAGTVIVPYGMAAGDSIIGLPALCHLVDIRGNTLIEPYGGSASTPGGTGWWDGIVLRSVASNPASQTTYTGHINYQFHQEAKSGGAYSFNGIAGEKTDFFNIHAVQEARTVGQKSAIAINQFSMSAGDTLPFELITTQFGGYGTNGDEQTVGIEDVLQQGSNTDGVGGVGSGTITNINGTSGVVTYTPVANENTMGEQRFIRDLGSVYSVGTYSNVTNSGGSPNTITVTGSGTGWTSIPGFVGAHTTFNNLATGGEITTNNLVFCPTPAANDGFDTCLPVTTGISDTSLTVNLYAVGTGMNTTWPSNWPTSGSYAIYRSAWPTTVDVNAHTFTACNPITPAVCDVSGLTNGHTFDQVLAYNMVTTGLRIALQRHIGMNLIGGGGGVDVANFGTSTSPQMQYGLRVNGNFYAMLKSGDSGFAGTPTYFSYSSKDFTGPMFWHNVVSATDLPIFDYDDSSGQVQRLFNVGRNAALNPGLCIYGSFCVSPSGAARGLPGQPLIVQGSTAATNDLVVNNAANNLVTLTVADNGNVTIYGTGTAANFSTAGSYTGPGGIISGGWQFHGSSGYGYIADLVNGKNAFGIYPGTEEVAFYGPIMSGGATNVAGCTLSGAVGGTFAGKFLSGTAGTCTVTVTPGITATNGFSCWANDLTTTADVIKQTATSTTTATLAGTTASGDAVNWGCIAY